MTFTLKIAFLTWLPSSAPQNISCFNLVMTVFLSIQRNQFSMFKTITFNLGDNTFVIE